MKKYKTIIHPGEVWVMNYRDKLKMPSITSTFSVYMFALWFAWSITPLWGIYAVSVGELSRVTQLHFPPNHPRALTMPWKCCLHNGCNLPNCWICLFITVKLMSACESSNLELEALHFLSSKWSGWLYCASKWGVTSIFPSVYEVSVWGKCIDIRHGCLLFIWARLMCLAIVYAPITCEIGYLPHYQSD